MLKIFICEDNQKQREVLEKVIKNYIMIENLDMEFSMSTDNPQDILDYLQEKPETIGLYFLDVDLNKEMSGIVLGSKIREIDAAGSIVFITFHGELVYLTFMHKVGALDYIVKCIDSEELKGKVVKNIKIAYERYLNISEKPRRTRNFKVKIAGKEYIIPLSEIMFLTTTNTPHKLALHMSNGRLEFIGSMKELTRDILTFVRVHQSYVINIDNIKSVNRRAREIEMMNDEKCLISARGLKELAQMVKLMENGQGL